MTFCDIIIDQLRRLWFCVRSMMPKYFNLVICGYIQTQNQRYPAQYYSDCSYNLEYRECKE